MNFKNRHKRNINLLIRYILGPLLFLWLSWSIWNQLQRQPDLSKAWNIIRSSFGAASGLSLAAVFALMLVNWWLESLKWRLLVSKIQPVTGSMAFKAILSGVAFSVT